MFSNHAVDLKDFLGHELYFVESICICFPSSCRVRGIPITTILLPPNLQKRGYFFQEIFYIPFR